MTTNIKLKLVGLYTTIALFALPIGHAVAASAWAPWAPNWSSANGFYDEWDYSDDPTGRLGEWGIDVPLAAGTPVYAPEAGTVVKYQASSTEWEPGRLLLRLDTGAVVGFGHVNDLTAPGTHVAGGAEIATIGNNGSNSHTEFMYDASGAGAPNYYNRANFLPSPPVSPASGCPRHTWTAAGGNGVDPCAVLTNYMHGTNSGSGSGASITGLTPSSAPIGVQVTISGTNLSGATQVAFNGAVASITSDTATQITTYVPNGATTGNLSVTTPTGTATSPFTVVPGGTLAGDITGNGRSDLIAVNETSAWAMLSTGSSFAAPADWHEGTFYGSRATLACDVNGDGKTDLVAVNDSSVWVMLSTGSGFSAPQLWSTGTFYGSRATLCADVNGDRKADLVAVNDTSAWVMRSTGTSFSAPVDWHEGTFYGSRATLACDVNGDRKSDLVAVNETSAWVMRSTGTSFTAPADWHEGTFYGSITTLCADVTGDHKADLVAVNETSAWVMRSTGSGFSAPADWHEGTFYGSRATIAGDVNGDGKADLVAVNETSAWVMRSTGSSFAPPVGWHEGTFYGW